MSKLQQAELCALHRCLLFSSNQRSLLVSASLASSEDARPIILVVAQMDSIDMFHDSVRLD
jgi:hypothetical protein